MHDVAVIGSGPAGIAAIYLKRTGFDVTLFEKNEIGGLLLNAYLVENYPGFPDGIKGYELSKNMKQHLIKWKITPTIEEVKHIEIKNKHFTLHTIENQYSFKAVIIANGTKAKKLGIPGEEELPPTETIMGMGIEATETLRMSPGTNETTILTVNNLGNLDLKEVKISFTGVPEGWVTVYPTVTNIEAGKSKDYLIIVSLPEDVSEEQTINFLASSSEGVEAGKAMIIEMAIPPTGVAFAVPKNILQLGVVIIAVAAVIIIAWELWFKKPSKS